MSVSHVYNYKRNRGDRALRQERHGHTVTPYLLPLALIAASIAGDSNYAEANLCRPHWSHRVHKLKELINLSILCNFQLFHEAITKEIAAIENCEIAGWQNRW